MIEQITHECIHFSDLRINTSIINRCWRDTRMSSPTQPKSLVPLRDLASRRESMLVPRATYLDPLQDAPSGIQAGTHPVLYLLYIGTWVKIAADNLMLEFTNRKRESNASENLARLLRPPHGYEDMEGGHLDGFTPRTRKHTYFLCGCDARMYG